MAHGTPDWWGSEPTSTVHLIQDVGELAARLGSEDTHHRGGNVLYIDGFENGLGPYDTLAGGAGSAVLISAESSRNGAYSCKLTTGAVESAYAWLAKYLVHPAISNVALELSATLDDDAVSVQIGFSVYDGTNLTIYSVRYVPSTNKWQYQGSGATWHDLATGVDLHADDKLFHTFKLVIDLDASEYLKLYYDDQEEDMSGLGGYPAANATAPRIYVWAYLFGGAVAAATIYIDDMIVTQNES